MQQVRLMLVHQMAAADYLRWHANHHRLRRNILNNHRVCADPAVAADGDIPEDLCARPNNHTALQGGVALDLFEAGAAEGDPVVEGHVVANNRCLTNHNPHAVVNEKAPAKVGSGMNLNSGDKASDLRAKACKPLKPVLPKPMFRAVSPNGMDARVAR